jgi:hypothetical protein
VPPGSRARTGFLTAEVGVRVPPSPRRCPA